MPVLAAAGAGALFVAAVAGVGVLAWGLTRTGGDQDAALTRSGASAPSGLLFRAYDPAGGVATLYSVASDGTLLTRITRVDSRPGNAALSPDGRWEVYACPLDPEQEPTDLCIASVDGSAEQVVTQGKLEEAGAISVGNDAVVWAPDSRAVAFVVDVSDDKHAAKAADLYLAAPSGSVRRLLRGESLYRPRWSPDGRYLALDSSPVVGFHDRVLVVNVADGSSAEIGPRTSAVDAKEDVYLQDFAWSADSNRLAAIFTSADPRVGPEPTEVQIANADGSGVRVFERPNDWQDFQWERQYLPSWSPDGTLLAIGIVPDGDMERDAQLVLLDTDSGETRSVSAGRELMGRPVWSPDGSAVAFAAAEQARGHDSVPRQELLIASPAGGAPRTLAEHASMAAPLLVTWSPDGSRLFYTAEGGSCYDSCMPGGLFVVPADGSSPPQRLTDVMVMEFLGWQE